ncbi:hypothetical protein ACFTUC_39470 [Streptomyces sp. NPDC056944]|uniref:hypothetical protein n=1 Tax=unclassified Streptomyces TaxID=2593676 RepID=UPI0036320947
MNRTFNRHHWRKIALACATAVLAVGCSSNELASPKPPATAPAATTTAPEPSASELPPDPAESAKKEAIATYLSHWQQVEKRYADKTDKAGELKKYAAVDALLKVENDAADMHRRNLVILGDVTVLNPTAVSTDINRKIPKVVISSCLDISRWTVTRVKTGEPATSLPKDRMLKYIIKATVEKWPQGWVVIRDEPQGKKC